MSVVIKMTDIRMMYVTHEFNSAVFFSVFTNFKFCK